MTADSPHPTDEDLVLLFYGEPDVGDDVGRHVQSCDACRTNLDALGRALATVDRHRIPERGAGYGAEVWARVQNRLDEPAAVGWSWFAPRRMLLAGSLAILVIAAFLAGRYSSHTPATARQIAAKAPAQHGGPVNTATSTPTVRDRVLLVAVGDHLERSQMVLVELMNKSADDGPVDISTTQEWARDLVPTNRLIRETADQANEPVVADVLDDLERTLVELANSPSELSKAEFERVRQRIEDQGLVFKIRVLDSQVREREQKSARAIQTRS